MPRLLRAMVVAIGLTSLLTAPVQAASLTDRMRAQDSRLSRKVTIQEPRIYVGELLERLAKQAQIEITPGSGKDGAGDDVIVAYVDEVAVGDVMDALWSLLSYRGATWHWKRVGRKGKYGYELVRPLNARRLSAVLRQQAQRDFEDLSRSLLATTRLTPEQRRARAKRGDLVGSLVGQLQRTNDGRKVFLESLSPKQQLRVLRGQSSPRIPVDQLSPAGRAFVRSIWRSSQGARARRDGIPNPIPEPQWIQFHVASHYDLTPALYILVEGLGGYSYSGGGTLEKAFRGKVGDFWKLDGDLNTNANGATSVKAKKETEAESAERQVGRFQAGRLGQLARGAPLSLLARLWDNQSRDPGPPGGQRVDEYLQRLQRREPRLLHKWRGPILLLTSLAWIQEDRPDTRVPWVVVKQLQAAVRRGDGFLSLGDLAALGASELAEGQLTRLAIDFPAVRSVIRWRPVFTAYARSQQFATAVTSKQGLPITQDFKDQAFVQESGLGPTLEDGRAYAIRLVDVERPRTKPPTRFIGIYVLDKEGRSLGGVGLGVKKLPIK